MARLNAMLYRSRSTVTAFRLGGEYPSTNARVATAHTWHARTFVWSICPSWQFVGVPAGQINIVGSRISSSMTVSAFLASSLDGSGIVGPPNNGADGPVPAFCAVPLFPHAASNEIESIVAVTRVVAMVCFKPCIAIAIAVSSVLTERISNHVVGVACISAFGRVGCPPRLVHADVGV